MEDRTINKKPMHMSSELELIQGQAFSAWSNSPRFTYLERESAFNAILGLVNTVISPEDLSNVKIHHYTTADGSTHKNIYFSVGDFENSSKPAVIVQAHYDSVQGCPGAGDNWSGVMALIALASRLSTDGLHESCGVQFHFAITSSEEPPYFGSKDQGAVHHTTWWANSRKGIVPVAVIVLDCVGRCIADGGIYEPSILGEHLDIAGWLGEALLKNARVKYGFLPVLQSDATWASMSDAHVYRKFFKGRSTKVVHIHDSTPWKFPGLYHSSLDTLDTISADSIAKTASLIILAFNDEEFSKERIQ